MTLDMADLTKRRKTYNVILHLEEFSTSKGGLLAQAPLPSKGEVKIRLALWVSASEPVQ